MRKRISFLLLSIFLLSGFTFGGTLVSNENWRTLAQGKAAFDEGENGEALMLCEKARNAHEVMIDGYVAALKNSLSSREVKKAGDDIDAVMDVLAKRDDEIALAIMRRVRESAPKDISGKSVSSLLSWIERSRQYPEADILSGLIYESEGELRLALTHYESAWAHRELLDVPDDRFDLAYRMSDISRNAGDYQSCEKYLFIVIEGDELFGRPGEESPSLRAMIRTLRNEKTPDKFFTLYRHSNYRALKAYQDLADFYYVRSNRIDRALPVAAIAAAISVTKLQDLLSMDDFGYSYANFPDMLRRAGESPRVSALASGLGLWDSFSMLAVVMEAEGMRAQAKSLWLALADSCPDPATVRKARIALSRAG